MQLQPLTQDPDAEIVCITKHQIIPCLHTSAIEIGADTQMLVTTFTHLELKGKPTVSLDTRPWSLEISMREAIRTHGHWDTQVVSEIADLIVPSGYGWSDRLKRNLVHLASLLPNTFFDNTCSFHFEESCEHLNLFEQADEMCDKGELEPEEAIAVKAAIIWRTVVDAFSSTHKLCSPANKFAVVKPSEHLFHHGRKWWFAFEQPDQKLQLELSL